MARKRSAAPAKAASACEALDFTDSFIVNTLQKARRRQAVRL
jgi:hypothetical protein